MLYYARTEALRTFRNKRYIIFVVAFPVMLYLLNANIYGEQAMAGGLKANAYLMVSMAAYGAMASSMMSTAVPWATERQSGWLRQLQITPLPSWMIIMTKLGVALLLTLPSLLLVSLAAILQQHVELSAGRWLGLLGVMWLGAIPFIALGLTFGSLLTADSAQPVSMICMFALAIAGGLWFPVEIMGDTFRNIAEAMPSFRYADMGWSIITGAGVPLTDVLVVAGWAVALGGAAAYAYRRATVRA
ncbi:ABC transporter permease [Nonomuraea sp. NBC_01738]|uniref:ABC transporter permease n=1 Tax=Nonomuraea sp. NBC_01738 TaxID=2976003 RepID=UPI002E12CE33|nr:ABC transporter permease [Nonomuraea sp. NBC_01738]